jgi:hypothetical protein
MLAMLNFNRTGYSTYKQYIEDDYNYEFDFDLFVRDCLTYHKEQIFVELSDYKTSTYNLFINDPTYNMPVSFASFQKAGKFDIKNDFNFENLLNYISISANTLVNGMNNYYLNIELLDFNYNKVTNAFALQSNDSEISTNDTNEFHGLLYLYQYLFNYFDTYYDNFKRLNAFFIDRASSNMNELQYQAQIILILLVIFHIIFISASLYSIIIYKEILMSEFTKLYGINEEKINKIKQKLGAVKELIKSENVPSSVYYEIRRLKELDMNGKGTRKRSSSLIKKQMSRQTTTGTTGTTGTTNTTSTNSSDNNGFNMNNSRNYLKLAKNSFIKAGTDESNKLIEDIKKEQEKEQISLALLNRLKFDFEFIRNYLYFIIFMSFFYLLLGCLVLYFSGVNYKKVTTNLSFEDYMSNKKTYLYNYLIGVKLSLLTNKNHPYIKTDNNFKSILDDYYNNLDNLTDVETSNSYFDSIITYNEQNTGVNICNNTYKQNNIELFKSLDPNLLTGLQGLCQKIPILHTNLDSIFSGMIMDIRKIFYDFIANPLDDRVNILENNFRDTDIVMLLFTDPYFINMMEVLSLDITKNSVNDYFTFLVVIFFVNISIDFMMLIFIWIKIYKQVMSYVNNVQLVTDSLTLL